MQQVPNIFQTVIPWQCSMGLSHKSPCEHIQVWPCRSPPKKHRYPKVRWSKFHLYHALFLLNHWIKYALLEAWNMYLPACHPKSIKKPPLLMAIFCAWFFTTSNGITPSNSGLRMVCGSYCIRCHMKTSYKFRNQLKISPVTSLKWWCEYPPTSCEVKVIWADGCEKSHLRILWLNKFLGRACCIQWNPSGAPPQSYPPQE